VLLNWVRGEGIRGGKLVFIVYLRQSIFRVDNGWKRDPRDKKGRSRDKYKGKDSVELERRSETGPRQGKQGIKRDRNAQVAKA